MASASETKTINAVLDHRQRAFNAEQRWKESFYRWEAQYFMRYTSEEITTRKIKNQNRQPRSTQFIGYAHAQIETAVAKALNAIWSRPIPFEVNPAGGANFEDANVIKALHSWSFDRDQMRKKSRQALRFMFIYGTVFWKHVWDENWLYKGDRVPVQTGTDNLGRPIWEYQTVREAQLMYEGPCSLIVDPYNFHIEPLAESIESARWVQEEFVRSGQHIKELMKQGIYRKIDLSTVGTHSVSGVQQDYKRRRQDVIGSNEVVQSDSDEDDLSPGMYDVIEETQDNRIITLIGGPGGPQRILRDTSNPFFHGRKHYTAWQHVDIANEPWAIPMSRQLEGPQSELNMIRRMRSDALLQSLRKMWRADPSARSRIREEDLVWRPNGIVYAAKDELEPLETPQLEIFSYKEEEILRQDGDIVTGITDVVRGAAAPSTTATVGNLNANFATDRLSMTLDSVADGMDEILTMRHQLFQQFATRNQSVLIAGPEGMKPVTASIDRIRGAYQFKFVCGRGLGQREVQRTQLLNVLTIAAQNPLVGQRTNFDNLLVDIYATFDALPDPSRYLLGTPAQSIPQEQELMVMLTGVQMPVNPNDNHMEHLMVLGQFVQSEQYQHLPPEIQQIIEMHGKEHLPFAKNQMLLGMGNGASGSPDRPSIPGAATNEADVMKTINRENAPNVAPNA